MAMNKNTGDKIDFFLAAILSRLEENVDFFENIDINFFSGNKEFKTSVKLSKGILTYIFNGKAYENSLLDFRTFVKENAPKYERMLLIYNERGKKIYIEADSKNVKTKTTDNIDEIESAAQSSSVGLGNREYYVKTGEADELLKTLGFLGNNGKIKNYMIRKYNQTDHFVELIHDLLVELAKLNGIINIIDCACGKSYLSFVLNYYIKEVLKKPCFFTGLDYNETVINASKGMAGKLGYNNMEFIQTDIMNYQPSRKYHLLLTLHACDTATDKALAVALNNKIESIVCVPCCHKELLSQYNLVGLEDVLKYGILKARIADALTDGLRGLYIESKGYDVSIVEYVSPLDTPKNLMIKAIKKKGNDPQKKLQYENIMKMLGTDLTLDKSVL